MLPDMSLLPFTIEERTAPVRTDRDMAVRRSPGAGREEAAGHVPLGYVYQGPRGPVAETYDAAATRTRLQGPHVPPGTFSLGAPTLEPPLAVTRRLTDGVTGDIGGASVLLRLEAVTSPRMRCLDVLVGDRAYAMVATGLLPRVALHREDHEVLAAFTVRGRRAHRIADDASGAEVVLTVLLTRFVLRLAHHS